MGGAGGRQVPTVIFGVDDSYVLGLGVALRSLSSTSFQDGGAHVVVFFCGLHAATQDLLRACVPPTWTVEFRPFNVAGHIDIMGAGRFTDAAYVRLVAVEELQDVERVVYLDSDIVVAGAIDELFAIDLNDRPVAAVRDNFIPTVGSYAGVASYEALGLPADTPYLNSGVLVIDVRRWTEEGIGARSMGYLAEHSSSAWSVTYPDQEALNVALAGDWLELPAEWNLGQFWPDAPVGHPLGLEIVPQAKIVHFITEFKPWLLPQYVPAWASTLFFHYLDKTPWAGWRPFSMYGARY
jgi:lipopolysaccharide biosynthesis glycosyltransferase